MSCSVDDFEFGQLLGEGSFGEVRVCIKKDTRAKFAAKILKKGENQIKYVFSERDILLSLNHPNIYRLYHAFHTEEHIYFILELVSGGPLQSKFKVFSFKIFSLSFGVFCINSWFSQEAIISLEIAQFYIAQLVSAVAHIHKKGIVHRDLKPENLLLSSEGHLKLVDFGVAKKIRKRRSHTFCGTTEYLAPEIIRRDKYDKGIDWWSVGCIIFELFTSKPPFKGLDKNGTSEKILQREINWPESLPHVVQDLCDKLLTIDLNNRLGCGKRGHLDVMNHPFFKGINWNNLPQQTAPLSPDNLSNLTEYNDEQNSSINNKYPDPFKTNGNIDTIKLASRDQAPGVPKDPWQRSEYLRQVSSDLRKLPIRPKPLYAINFKSDIGQTMGINLPAECTVNTHVSITGLEDVSWNYPVTKISWNSSGASLATSSCLKGKMYRISSDMDCLDSNIEWENIIGSTNYFLAFNSEDMLAYDMRRNIGIRPVNSQDEELKGHKMPVLTAAFSEANPYILASGGYEYDLKLWNVDPIDGMREFSSINIENMIRNAGWYSHVSMLAFQPKETGGELFAVCIEGISQYLICNAESGEVVHKVAPHKQVNVRECYGGIKGVDWSPTEPIVLSWDENRIMAATDAITGETKSARRYPCVIKQCKWSPNGKYIASITENECIVWNWPQMECECCFPFNAIQMPGKISWESSSRFLALGGDDPYPTVVYVPDNSRVNVSGSHESSITTLEFSNHILATASVDCSLRLWRLVEK